MRILLLGKSGQVGFELKRTLSPLGYIIAPSRSDLELINLGAVRDFLDAEKPSLIVNAAAWTDVDGSEENQELAYRLNTLLPKVLVDYSNTNRCKLVHYSSDYVYPGTGIEPWSEESDTRPVNYYGETKLKGDQVIVGGCSDYLIFRTSWVYSARRNNFMKTMLHLAESKKELSIINDQVGSPTTARLIAQTTLLALQGQLSKGVYNLSAKGQISWYQFAKAIFDEAELLGFHSALQKVSPISTAGYPTIAERPRNSRMDTSKIENALGVTLPSWENELINTLEEYLEKK